MTSLAPIIAELERLYGVLTDAVFPEKLRDMMHATAPVVAIASRGRKRTVNAWYVPSVWTDVTDDLLDALVGATTSDKRVQTKRAECVLASELLRETPLDIATELTRTMVAHSLAIRGYTDVIPGESNYYPRSWTDYASQVDCYAAVNPEQPSKGWSVFDGTQAFDDTVTPLLRPDVFDMSRDGVNTKNVQANRMLKYACGCTVIRSAMFVSGTCNMCNERWMYADKHECPVVLKNGRTGRYVSTDIDDNPTAFAYANVTNRKAVS